MYLKPANTTTPITKALDLAKAYKLPIAHGEGRFYAADDTMKSIQDNDQVLFQYASATGEVNEQNNPNGSLLNIAGICNKNRNVFGMMPHPERASDSLLANQDGLGIFESMIKIVHA